MEVTIASLWLPVLLSSVLVFLTSWVAHAVLKHHQNDYLAVPDEDALREALAPLEIPPGQYISPKAESAAEIHSSAFQERVESGPAVMMTVLRPESLFNMAPGLAKWFGYCALVGVFCAYVASRALAPGEEYLTVFRLVGAVAFACYAMGELPRSIWWSQKWSVTLKSVLDGLVYSLVTAGVFGWLWPG